MAPEVVARYGFSGGRHVSKSSNHAAQIALQFGTNPEPVGQEAQHARQVGQQVGMDGDGQSRTALRGGFNGPLDVGLRAALLPDEQSIAPACIPSLEFPNIGATVEVDQSVPVCFTVPHERLVALAERMGVVEVARCTGEVPKFVDGAFKHLRGADGR